MNSLHGMSRRGLARPGLARLGGDSDRPGVARNGKAGRCPTRQGVGRLAGTGVQAPGVHARPGLAVRGSARLGEVRHGRDGRVAHIQVRVLDAYAWLGGVWLGLARRGMARLREVRQGDGRLADIEVRVLDAHARGMAGQRSVRRGKAVLGAAGTWMGEWSTSEFESPTPTRGSAWPGRSGLGNARRGAARLGKADGWQPRRVRGPGVHDWQGKARQGQAGRALAGQGHKGEWISSRFDSATPTTRSAHYVTRNGRVRTPAQHLVKG